MKKKKDNILIVDDENKALELLSIFMHENLPEALIDLANHSYMALEMMKRKDYDLLLLDYEMPQMNGTDILREIQQMKHIPQIMLVSAYRNFDFAKKGIEIGVLEYIVKPIDNKQIAKAITKYKKSPPLKQPDQIILPAYNGIHLIDLNKICFIEKVGRNKLLVQLSDNIQYEINGSLSELEKQLPNNYIYISRQCIVNRSTIKTINNKCREICLQTSTNTFTLLCSRNQMKRLINLYNV